MDDVGGGNWIIDPLARHAMLMEASRAALARGAFSEAVTLAEELLDDAPDELEALLIIAEAAPRYGHAEVGVLAATQAGRRGLEVGALEAAALLAARQVERALERANALLARAPDHARGHAVRGQALDLLGRTEEAEQALARAFALRPEHYPLPLTVEPAEWDSLLFAAQASLETNFRDVLRRVDITLADLPRLADLHEMQPPPSPLVDALLDDVPGERPRIVLYRRNLLRGCATVEELTDRIREALLFEAELLRDGEG